MKRTFQQQRIGVSVLLAFFVLSALFCQEKIGKEIHKTYNLTPDSKLSISNKYGNIDVRNWEKQVVDIKVQIVFKGIDEKKMQEILKSIEIQHNVEGNVISFETVFSENFNRIFSNNNDGDKGYEVNYIVNMPHTLVVNLNNKYGNVFIDKLSSPSVIDIKYGKLKANNIISENKDPMTELILGYSEATIELSSWLKVNMKYSKISIETSKALIVMSKYSKIFVEKGSSLVTESKYDEFDIGTVANFVTESEYCNFRFKSITKKLQAETSYSDLKVDFIPKSFEVININNRYGTYRLGVDELATYTLKGIARYGDIEYPSDSRVNRFDENNQLSVEGKVGKAASTTSKVVIDTQYGSIKLSE